MMGCSTPRLPEFGARYTPVNVHAVPAMPASIRRVALLPLASHRADQALVAGTENLGSAVEMELRKSGMFEVVLVSEAEMHAWTGRRQWRADEPLPQGFFVRLMQEKGCDALLFPVLSAFRPYPPMALGLDLRLIDCSSHATLWAVDEVLDAGAAPVARLARDYARAQLQVRADDDSAILQSPTRFARFASATLMSTLPTRQILLKTTGEPTMPKAEGQP